MIATLASSPVPAGQMGESFCAASLARMAGDVEGDAGLFALIERTGASDNRKASRSRQSRFYRLDGIDRYCALVATSVAGIGLLDMGKKGVVSASFEAAL